MATVLYTINTGQPPFTIQVNPGGLCTDNCNHTLFTSTSSAYNDAGLTKGVSYNLTLQVTDSFSCTNSVGFVHCCPSTGGNVTGNLNPEDNSLATYTLSGVVGTATLSWQITGGNAYIQSTGLNQVSVNVGTQDFVVAAKLTDCSGERIISLSVFPSPSCLMTVSTPIFTC